MADPPFVAPTVGSGGAIDGVGVTVGVDVGWGVVAVGIVASVVAVGATVADDPQAPITTATANPTAGSKIRGRRWRMVGTRELLDWLQGPDPVAA